MLLGLGEDEKKFKDAMDAAGADMANVKAWLKIYSKTKKNALNTAGRYYSVKEKLQNLMQLLRHLELILVENKSSVVDRSRINSFSKERRTDSDHIGTALNSEVIIIRHTH